MAILSITERQLASRQFERFRLCLDVSRAEAIGLLILFWHDTRADSVTHAKQDALLTYAPVPPEKGLYFVRALAAAGYITDSPEGGDCEIVGNAQAVARLQVARARGQLGGQARAKKKAAKKTRAKAAAPQPVITSLAAAPAADSGRTPLQLACSAAWLAYAKAFEQRVARLPVRNQKTNALILQAVQRLGYEVAPRALKFYVEHFNEPFFIRELWPLQPFLAKAEAIACQLDMGRVITTDDAKALSQSAAYHARQADILSGRR